MGCLGFGLIFFWFCFVFSRTLLKCIPPIPTEVVSSVSSFFFLPVLFFFFKFFPVSGFFLFPPFLFPSFHTSNFSLPRKHSVQNLIVIITYIYLTNTKEKETKSTYNLHLPSIPNFSLSHSRISHSHTMKGNFNHCQQCSPA